MNLVWNGLGKPGLAAAHVGHNVGVGQVKTRGNDGVQGVAGPDVRLRLKALKDKVVFKESFFQS